MEIMELPTVIINNNKELLSIAIDNESVNIYVDKGEDNEPLHIVYWHIDEVDEDSSVAISIVTAVQLYYTNPQLLIDTLKFYN